MAADEERITADLLLRTVRDERDIDRFAAFNTAINDATQGRTCANLLRYHPQATYDDFFFVEDERSGEVVSTICLIPWRCTYLGVPLNVAMLEMVATHPAYRHHGLVRAQIKRFHQVVSERGFDLSIIEGIPYYYRQYGYGYAGDHWRSDSLPVWRIPAGGANNALRLRPAALADIPRLVDFYAQAMSHLQVATLRDADYWRFLLEHEKYPVEMIEETASGAVIGYLCIFRRASRQQSHIVEASVAGAEVALALLQMLKGETANEIQIGWAVADPLLQVARALGSTPVPGDQWLLRLPDVAGLLSKLTPVLEQRIAASAWAGVTTELRINLFRQAFALHLVAGKIKTVTPLGFVDASMGADGGDLCIPPDAFVRLLFGYRTLGQLFDVWPDIVVKPERRLLIETLFPPLQGYFWMPYLYYG